ncbi:META domain-containing protein [Kaistella jeonii]|uniref:DUF306 domain-containing protein n=1 Tax=Kaistella jeonii TaxID=266749 RepID=A0A0C1F885_9FLAO|nr:META domain-containing protein [Kaistella jeonii]KIA89377.1 hypothetical protein OA86_07235 [Kaistella jeonii]SFC04111.1 Heat shock protein HslJ [Kaistella jeonii]VEI96703.1 heat-inducible protein [Kaistella jeonii]
MKILTSFSFFIVMVSSISCSVITKSPAENVGISESNSSETSANTSQNIYFKGSGNEPFWNVEISEGQIKLKTITESIVAPSVEAIIAADHNVKLYRTQTANNDIINIQIVQNKCTNAMSGEVSSYSVSVEYQKYGDSKMSKLEGCGNYITDYRLNDIWVLETLDGNKVELKNFQNKLPSMEINSATNSFSGFSGCNRMNGQLFFEKGLLRFTDITTTKMMCDPNNQENAFLKAMKSTTTYKIENNRLWLSNPSGLMLIFKKID